MRGGRKQRQKEASSFPYVGLVFYLFSCAESSFYVLFLRVFDVRHCNRHVLLWPVSTEIVVYMHMIARNRKELLRP